MSLPAKLFGIAGVALLSVGCGIPLTTDDLRPDLSKVTIGATRPSAQQDAAEDERGPVPDLTCLDAPRSVLRDVEVIGNVGGGVTYPEGKMVRAGGEWWAVAVRRRVDPNSGFDRKSFDDGGVEVFITNAPSDSQTLRGSPYLRAPYGADAWTAVRKCIG